MAFLVKLPPLGEGIFEAQCVAMNVKEGDEVKEGDVLAEMQTDKAVGALAAPTSGRIEKIYIRLWDYIFRDEKVFMIDDGKAELTTAAGGDAGRVQKDGSITAPPEGEKLAGGEKAPAKPAAAEPAEAEKPVAAASREEAPEPVDQKPLAPKPAAAKPEEAPAGEPQLDLEKAQALGTGSVQEILQAAYGKMPKPKDQKKPNAEFMKDQGQAQQGAPKPSTTRTHRYLEPLQDNFNHSRDGSKPIPTHLANAKTEAWYLEAGRHTKASPAVREYAAKHGIDISEMPTNDEGIITMEEVEYAASHAVGEREWNFRKIDTMDPGYWTHRADEEFGREETYIRKYNASRFEMSHNKTVPFAVFTSIDTTALKALTKKMDALAGEQKPYLFFVAMAVIEACQRFPELNCSLDDTESIFRFKNYVNMGFEMNTVQGLFTPVIKDAHEMSLEDLVTRYHELEHEVMVERIFNYETNSEGTITLSDVSHLAQVEHFQPVVHYPEAAIFGLNAIREEVIVEKGEMTIKPMLPISLVVDHRILARDTVFRVLDYVKDLLEDPYQLLYQF